MWAATAPKVPVLQHVGQPTFPSSTHTLSIHYDTSHIQPPRADGLDSVHVGELLAQDSFPLLDPVATGVPYIGEEFHSLGQAIGVSAG